MNVVLAINEMGSDCLEISLVVCGDDSASVEGSSPKSGLAASRSTSSHSAHHSTSFLVVQLGVDFRRET